MGRKPMPKEDAVIFLEKLHSQIVGGESVNLYDFLGLLPTGMTLSVGTVPDLEEWNFRDNKWSIVCKYCDLQGWINIVDDCIKITRLGEKKIGLKSDRTKIENRKVNKITAQRTLFASEDGREGQERFRKELIEKYNECLISGNCTSNILEAAHVKPHSEEGEMDISNGILLTRNLHKLFDDGLILLEYDDIYSKIVVHIHPSMKENDATLTIRKTEVNLPEYLKIEFLRERFEKDKCLDLWKGRF